MKITKDEIIHAVHIMWTSNKKFSSSAKLRHEGCIIELPFVDHDTIDEAVKDIKARIIDALLKFKVPHDDIEI